MSKIYHFLVGFFVIIQTVTALNYTSFLHSEQYHVSTSTATYAQALFDCKRMGWTMAIEDSAEVTLELNRFLTETSHSADNVWLGGVYQEISGYASQWIWIDSGEIIEYTHWQSGEPNQSSSDPCLRKNALSTTNTGGQWYAAVCTNTFYFVCQGE